MVVLKVTDELTIVNMDDKWQKVFTRSILYSRQEKFTSTETAEPLSDKRFESVSEVVGKDIGN